MTMDKRVIKLSDYYRIAAENVNACASLLQRIKTECKQDLLKKIETDLGPEIFDEILAPMSFACGLRDGDYLYGDAEAAVATSIDRHRFSRAFFRLCHAVSESQGDESHLLRELIQIQNGLLRMIGKKE